MECGRAVEGLLTENLRTKQTDEQLKKVSLRLSHSRLKYFKEKALNNFLQQQGIENTVLRQLLSLTSVKGLEQSLRIEERFVQSQETSYQSSWRKTKQIVQSNLNKASEEECKKLLQWIHNSSNGFDKDRLKTIPLTVQEKMAAVKLKQEEIIKLKRTVSNRNVELHKLISDNCRQLLSFLTDYQLRHVTDETRITLDHLSCKTDALKLKLDVVKLQLMADTYSSDKTEALRIIRSHLDEYKKQLEIQLTETEHSLLHYESLGSAFMSLAKEYHQLLGDIDNKKWALQELRKTKSNK